MATHFRKLAVKDIRKETADCVSIAFAVPTEWTEEFAFTQGQNITIRTTLDGEEIRRSYSICSSPFEKELRVAVKKMDQGRFSTFANQQLKKGDVLEVLPPTGKFYTPLDPAHQKNYLAFAAGSGITPIISIIKTTLQTEPHSTFTLLFGNRNRSSIIFKEELEALKNRYMDRLSLYHVLSREKTEAPVQQGYIDAEKIDFLFEHLIDRQAIDDFFICGPEAMIFTVKEYLLQNGTDPRHVHFELFTTPGKQLKAADRPQTEKKEYKDKVSRVTVKLDGNAVDFDLPFDGDAILDAALKQGADLPFACKGGVCATCRAKLVSGEVEMDTNYALEPEETEAGFILTCQSHPRTEKVVVDFDIK